MALLTDENVLLALLPTRRIVPTTITRITASITAYSAISWPSLHRHSWRRRPLMFAPLTDSTPISRNRNVFHHVYCRRIGVTDVNRWDEKAGLRRDAVRSQVIDVLEAQEIKETGNEEG